jgi:hypothetical protein
MKFSLAALLATLTTSSVLADISASSTVGQHLLSQARRLDGEVDWETEYAWISGYSVKFQGCLAVKQWNDEADDKDEVRIMTKRLVRFRLCPSDSCSATKAAGCSSGYGDYIIDMDTFMQSYMEGKRTADEWECANYLEASCDCEDSDDKADDFNPEYCEYDCFKAASMTQCIDRNPYEDDQQQGEKFNLEDYMECREVKQQNNNNNNNGDEQVQYFVGPYCSSQGGSIKLGLFTDDSCSVEAEDVDFYSLFGYTLPYSGSSDSLIDAKCLSCKETQEQNNKNENDQQDVDAISQMCEEVYNAAGKCESSYPSGMVTSPNTNACTYMEGVKVIRQDGIIDTGSSRPSAVATRLFLILAMAFCARGFYLWFLRTRLGVNKNTMM